MYNRKQNSEACSINQVLLELDLIQLNQILINHIIKDILCFLKIKLNVIFKKLLDIDKTINLY